MYASRVDNCLLGNTKVMHACGVDTTYSKNVASEGYVVPFGQKGALWRERTLSVLWGERQSTTLNK